MTMRRVMTTMVCGVSMMMASVMGLAAPRVAPSGSAANVPVLLPVAASQAKPGKVRQVAFSLENGTAAVLRLRAGADEILLQPGETRKVKLAEGTALTTVDATPRLAAGAMLTTVSNALHGVTMRVS